MNILSMLNQMGGQNLYENLLKNNPQFAKFVADNKGKPPQQIAQENGIDYTSILKMLK